jgi:L-2,4-diaminobutyrate decarboxylase
MSMNFSPDEENISAASLEEARQRILAAYAPEVFEKASQRLSGLLTQYMSDAESSKGDVLPWTPPAEMVEIGRRVLDSSLDSEASDPESAERRFTEIVEVMLAHSHRLHDPRYIGHQVPAPVPLGGLFDAVGSVTNQVMAVYEMGPWATAVERVMVETLGQEIGWTPGEFTGVVTHGGSLANLTALLTARNIRLGDVWNRGLAYPEQGEPVIVAQADSHYSIARAAGVMGLGVKNVIPVPLDERRRMDPAALEAILSRLEEEHRPVIAVVAGACATPIGAFDPLPEIGAICRRREIWLHIDAAHGGAALLSPTYRTLLDGIDQADSVVWDAHKMLFTPGLCAFVFYKDKGHADRTFHQEAPYLFDPTAPELADYDSGVRTLECTKRAAAFGIWGLWAMFGRQLFVDLVETTFAMGAVFHQKLDAAEDFVPLHRPQCNIVAFRHIPEALRDASPDILGRFQFELRRKLIESGEFYIVSTALDGVGALRATVMNPLTQPEHIDALLDALRRHGQELLTSMKATE